MHVLNHFTYIYVCVESKVGCFTASKHDTMMSSGHCLTLSFPISAFSPHHSLQHHYHNSVRVSLYDHPQHMQVLNHFIYMQYGCGKQSEVIYSLQA